MTLRARTLVLVALCVLPAFAVALYMAHAARADAAADAQRSVVALARIAAAEQQQLIGQARQILHVLAQLLRVDGLAEGQACNRILADAIRIETRFANFGVVGRDGYLRCSALPWQAPVYLGDRAYFRDAIASRAFTIGDFQVGRVTGAAASTSAIRSRARTARLPASCSPRSSCPGSSCSPRTSSCRRARW